MCEVVKVCVSVCVWCVKCVMCFKCVMCVVVKCMCVCVREREIVFVCVCERERESVCVCVRERVIINLYTWFDVLTCSGLIGLNGTDGPLTVFFFCLCKSFQ